MIRQRNAGDAMGSLSDMNKIFVAHDKFAIITMTNDKITVYTAHYRLPIGTYLLLFPRDTAHKGQADVKAADGTGIWNVEFNRISLATNHS
jgi:hypothetical protein